MYCHDYNNKDILVKYFGIFLANIKTEIYNENKRAQHDVMCVVLLSAHPATSLST